MPESSRGPLHHGGIQVRYTGLKYSSEGGIRQAHPIPPVTKGRLAALIRVQSKPHSVHNARLKAEDDWSDVASNDPNDQIGDRIEKSPESLEYPFEMVRSADGNGLRIKRPRKPNLPGDQGYSVGSVCAQPGFRRKLLVPSLPRPKLTASCA